MQTVLFTILTLFIVTATQAQITVNHGKELVQLDTLNGDFQQPTHIHVSIYNRFMNLKVRCAIDYGQEKRLFQRQSSIRTTEGKKMLFNSEAHVIQYIKSNGWEYKGYDGFYFVFTRPEN